MKWVGLFIVAWWLFFMLVTLVVSVRAESADDLEWLACGARDCWEIEPIIFVESAFGITKAHEMRSELGCFLARDIALREHVDAAACFPNEAAAKAELPALKIGRQ